MAPYIWNRAQLFCELEGTEGTAETIVAADVFLVHNITVEPIIEPHERKPASEDLSPYPSVFGARSAKVSFDVELTGVTAAGDALHYRDALLACGFAETLVPATSATYLPASSSVSSATLKFILDNAKSYTFEGCRGSSLKLSAEVGKPAVWTFEFMCADFAEADASFVGSTSYNAILPPTFQNATFTIGGVSMCITSLEIDFGIESILRKCVTSDSGHLSNYIIGRKPTMTIDPEQVLVATDDPLGDWRAGTQAALNCVIGSAAGNIHTITAPKVQYQSINTVESDGIARLEIQALLARNAGDDEFSYVLT